MLLYPDRVAALQTDAPPEAVLARLAGGVGEPPGTILFGGAPADPFVGVTRGETFPVTPPLRQMERWGGRRVLRPVLEDDVQPDGTGTVVHRETRNGAISLNGSRGRMRRAYALTRPGSSFALGTTPLQLVARSRW